MQNGRSRNLTFAFQKEISTLANSLMFCTKLYIPSKIMHLSYDDQLVNNTCFGHPTFVQFRKYIFKVTKRQK